MENYKGYSPWGGIQVSNVLAKGFKAVSTAGHGGYMVTSTFAAKYLTVPCIKRAFTYSNYLCYEEDCDYAILLYDLLFHHKDIFENKIIGEKYTLEETMISLKESISCYNPDYLFEIGETPAEEQYGYYLERKEIEEMRRSKNPDLIISALSENDEVTRVITADSKHHYVKSESYSKIFNTSKKLLLSDCEMVLNF